MLFMQRRTYSTDLTDEEWALLEPLLPKAKSGPQGGRPASDRREVINGIRYVVRSGCAWRLLPHDLPPWGTCYSYFRKWGLDGTWQKIHDRLRGDLRESVGRHREASAGILDSQSVKTTEKGGLVATMRGRKSVGASATFSSIPSGCSCWSSFIQRASRIAMAPNSFLLELCSRGSNDFAGFGPTAPMRGSSSGLSVAYAGGGV